MPSADLSAIYALPPSFLVTVSLDHMGPDCSARSGGGFCGVGRNGP